MKYLKQTLISIACLYIALGITCILMEENVFRGNVILLSFLTPVYGIISYGIIAFMDKYFPRNED